MQRRIALLHYSAEPAIGGVEKLIQAQVEALLGLGHQVRLVVGFGEKPIGAELRTIEAMCPDHPSVLAAGREFLSDASLQTHPVTRSLMHKIGLALEDCTDCWVHNALTITLNPFLTVALAQLAAITPYLRWVAWCEDLSVTSAYVAEADFTDEAMIRAVLRAMRVVTISGHRAAELCRILGIPSTAVRVIQPPLDVASWLGLGEQTTRLVGQLQLHRFIPSVLIPAKMLPHKNLFRALDLADGLVARGCTPLVLFTGARSIHQPDLSRSVIDDLVHEVSARGLDSSVRVAADLTGVSLFPQTVRELMMLTDLVFLASEEEGFGMPLVEAAAVRAPVLCSDIPAFREALGDAARYFPSDATDVKLAGAAAEIAALPWNRARRDALASIDRFAAELRSLLD
ncbi:MAG: glycosyltransferase [Chloroflexota bacterium]|nr:glycosyltransferase [Chloroflexota bacterium]